MHLVLFTADIIGGECDRRCGHIHQRIHAITIKPLARDIHADIGPILVVRKDDFHIEAALTKILHRLPCGGDGGAAGDVAIHAGHVHGHTELDGIGGVRLGATPGQPTQRRGCASLQNISSVQGHCLLP